MQLSFVGTGYVGLVSGTMMSHLGHKVICLDTDRHKVEKLKNKKIPIYEPGLAKYIEKHGNTERLQFVYGYDASIKNSDCLLITVGTPPKENGEADLNSVFEAVESASNYVNSECIIILKSTVPPGTCQQLKEFMQNKNKLFDIVSNPEFLREGNAIKDFLEPDRIVIGAHSERAFSVMRQIYKPLTDQGIKLVETDLHTSELIKYASNAFLANKIAFINEMADLCEIVGADIDHLAKGVGLDKRIGEDFLRAGPGFGGSCFPKDILALQKLANKRNSDFLILDAVIKANNNRPNSMINKISTAIGGKLQHKKLAILGLTYKAGTDDLRNSPVIKLIKQLQKQGADIIAYDPKGMVNTSKYFEELNCADSINSAIKRVDAIIIATEWPEFKDMDLGKTRKLVKTPVIIDLRNILVPKEVESEGFKYYSIGRKSGK